MPTFFSQSRAGHYDLLGDLDFHLPQHTYSHGAAQKTASQDDLPYDGGLLNPWDVPKLQDLTESSSLLNGKKEASTGECMNAVLGYEVANDPIRNSLTSDEAITSTKDASGTLREDGLFVAGRNLDGSQQTHVKVTMNMDSRPMEKDVEKSHVPPHQLLDEVLGSDCGIQDGGNQPTLNSKPTQLLDHILPECQDSKETESSADTNQSYVCKPSTAGLSIDSSSDTLTSHQLPGTEIDARELNSAVQLSRESENDFNKLLADNGYPFSGMHDDAMTVPAADSASLSKSSQVAGSVDSFTKLSHMESQPSAAPIESFTAIQNLAMSHTQRNSLLERNGIVPLVSSADEDDIGWDVGAAPQTMSDEILRDIGLDDPIAVSHDVSARNDSSEVDRVPSSPPPSLNDTPLPHAGKSHPMQVPPEGLPTVAADGQFLMQFHTDTRYQPAPCRVQPTYRPWWPPTRWRRRSTTNPTRNKVSKSHS